MFSFFSWEAFQDSSPFMAPTWYAPFRSPMLWAALFAAAYPLMSAAPSLAASQAPLKSPLKSRLIAFPSDPSPEMIPFIRSMTNVFRIFPKPLMVSQTPYITLRKPSNLLHARAIAATRAIMPAMIQVRGFAQKAAFSAHCAMVSPLMKVISVFMPVAAAAMFAIVKAIVPSPTTKGRIPPATS